MYQQSADKDLINKNWKGRYSKMNFFSLVFFCLAVVLPELLCPVKAAHVIKDKDEAHHVTQQILKRRLKHNVNKLDSL